MSGVNELPRQGNIAQHVNRRRVTGGWGVSTQEKKKAAPLLSRSVLEAALTRVYAQAPVRTEGNPAATYE
jgi:hypothetical protein